MLVSLVLSTALHINILSGFEYNTGIDSILHSTNYACLICVKEIMHTPLEESPAARWSYQYHPQKVQSGLDNSDRITCRTYLRYNPPSRGGSSALFMNYLNRWRLSARSFTLSTLGYNVSSKRFRPFQSHLSANP